MKDYDYYRHRSLICTVISVSFLLTGIALSVHCLHDAGGNPIVPDSLFYTAITLCFIGLITFFIGMGYEQKSNWVLNNEKEKRRLNEIEEVFTLIAQYKTKEAISGLIDWVEKYHPFKENEL
jgi:hypothetical protein